MKMFIKREMVDQVEWFQSYFDKHWDELHPEDCCEIIGPDGLIWLYSKLQDEDHNEYFFLYYGLPGGTYIQIEGGMWGTMDGIRFYKKE